VVRTGSPVFPQALPRTRLWALDEFRESGFQSLGPLHAPRTHSAPDATAILTERKFRVQAATASAQPGRQPTVTAKIIEFPRSWTPPLPALDELAEPVIDRPRILEVP